MSCPCTYTKFDTDEYLERLAEFLLRTLTEERFLHYLPKALVKAPSHIVMKNNRIGSEDIIVQYVIDRDCHRGCPRLLNSQPICGPLLIKPEVILPIKNIYLTIFQIHR